MKPVPGTDTPARWWALLEKARRKDADDYERRLLDALRVFTVDEIVAFDRFVQERLRDAFRADLWEVAHLMSGGCSDDGFDYFLGWLVSRGRARYEAALANPEAAAKGVSPEDEPFEFEALWYIGERAYKAATGKDDYLTAFAPAVTRTLQGTLPEEEAIVARHPKLAARFGAD